jgi:SAM-dependent methyltransferase
MRLNELRNDRGEIWLNVASSHYPVEGFINLDNHAMMFALDFPILVPFVPSKNKDLLDAYRAARNKGRFVRHDCRKPLPVPDSSIDHILCSHFLEHVYPDEAVAILTDFRRALKPGATMHIIVPDLEAQIHSYLDRRRAGSPAAADDFVRESLLSSPQRGSLKYRILEFLGGFGLQHRWMYDQVSIASRIKELNFLVLDRNDTPSKTVRANDGSVHIVAQKPRAPSVQKLRREAA